jgi:hypothetical protein
VDYAKKIIKKILMDKYLNIAIIVKEYYAQNVS